MQSATLTHNKDMFNVKMLGYLSHPKVLFTVLVLDLSGIISFITKYVFADINYLKFLVIACAVDFVTGVTKVWKNQGIKAITSRGLRDSVTKIISYGSFLIITHVLTHYEINGQVTSSFAWLNKIAFEFLIMIEVKSVYENLIAINPKLDFIDGLLNKIKSLKSK